MSDELLKYYNRELAFLRHMGADFAKQYPRVAGRIAISEDSVEDPHVSRLLEGVALLSAQIRQKLDDSFPELTEALLGQLYPDYHAPIPSMTIMKMDINQASESSVRIAKGREVKVSGFSPNPCRFQTCYDVEVWPIEVSEASLENAPFKAPKSVFKSHAKALLKLKLTADTSMAKLNRMGIKRLRLHLHGQAQLTHELYQLLFHNVLGMAFAQEGNSDAIHYLSPRHIASVGFGENENVVPYDKRMFDSYRLLVESFIFPEKFLFVDLIDLEPDWFGDENNVELYIYLNQGSELLTKQLKAENILLGCVPIINLYRDKFDSKSLESGGFEHRLVASYGGAENSEIIRVLSVEGHNGNKSVELTPFYGSHLSHQAQKGNLFWTVRREYNARLGDSVNPSTETYLSVVDGNAAAHSQTAENQWRISGEALLSNRNLPARFPFNDDSISAYLEKYADVTNVRCLSPFSEPIRPAMFDASRWQLASHLSLNHFSRPDAVDILKQLFQLYDFRQDAQTKALIDAISAVDVSRTTARIVQDGRVGFAHGNAVSVEFFSQDVSGVNLYFFGCILRRFFVGFTTINSFVQFNLRILGNAEPLYSWPAMAGDRELL